MRQDVLVTILVAGYRCGSLFTLFARFEIPIEKIWHHFRDLNVSRVSKL